MSDEVDLDSPAFVSAFDEAPLWSARFGALLLRHLEIQRDLDILDVGCGTGFPLFELASVHGSSCRVVGVDRWRAALARAAEKRAAYGLGAVTLVEADAAHLPFPGGCFDLVVSNLGLNNFDDPGAVLAECARVSRPGARLALTTNPFGLMREVYAALAAVMATDEERARLARQEAHRATPAALCAWLEAGGFTVRRVIEDEHVQRFASGEALLAHPLIRVGFWPGWRSAIEPARVAATRAALAARLDAGGGEVRATVPMLYVEAARRAPAGG